MGDLLNKSVECRSWVDEEEDGLGCKGKPGRLKHGRGELIRVFHIEPREFLRVFGDVEAYCEENGIERKSMGELLKDANPQAEVIGVKKKGKKKVWGQS
jgi:hypothetical protein